MLTTKTKQFIVSFKPQRTKLQQASFFERAKKNIIKGNKRANRDLSKRVDKIVYGV